MNRGWDMNSDPDDMDMSPFYYFDNEKLSSEGEKSENEKEEFEVEMDTIRSEEFDEIDVDNGNSFDNNYNFQKRRMDFGYLYNSSNYYPKLIQDNEKEEKEVVEEEEEFIGNNRRITSYSKPHNYGHGFDEYGSPPEEERRDNNNNSNGYNGEYKGGYGYSSDYNSSYRATFGNYGNYNGHDRRDHDKRFNYNVEGYRFRNDDKIGDVPSITRGPFYSNYRNSGLSGYSESSLSGPSTPEPIRGKLSREEGGHVGLRNLGNTCYLNSTLQCLTATIELSYRLAEDFERGELAKRAGDKIFLTAMARLFHEMWQSDGKLSSIGRCVIPTQFKNVLGQVDSRFSGYRQEDSQEALAIILDRIHEEMKSVDSDDDDDDDAAGNSFGATDLAAEIVANDGWEEYCKKENSLVRELFHGQLKSTLECCECSFKSETYEPFCFLNLPIPVQDHEPSINYRGDIRTIYDYKISTKDDKYDVSNTVTSASSTKFNILCFNDKIYNSESSYLIMNRSFKSLNEFRLFFRGAGVWVVELEENRVLGIKTKLPSIQELSNLKHAFIAFKAEIMFKNHLVTFVAGKSGEIVGFPILLRTKLNETLTPVLFIENFLKSTIRSILVHRFPERLQLFDFTLSLMIESANEYFKVESMKSDPIDLLHVKVVILNDKSDFNEFIFFKEVDDPNDLFEELCIDLVSDRGDSISDVSDVSDDSDVSEASEVSEVSEASEVKTDLDSALINCNYNTHRRHSPIPPSSNISLKDCFDKLFSIEKFNEWKCEKCGIPVGAEKRLELWRLPEILILHLKRFSFGSNLVSISSGGSKISKAVDFPLKLDMKAEIPSGNSSEIYELFGVSQHFGSLNFGHYTAILKHQPTGKWFLADDGTITIYEDEIEWNNQKVKESAYVLFYRRIE